MKYTKQYVSYTGYGVFKYPEGLEGWQFGRFEYGGSNEDCIMEQTMWLPPNVDPYEICRLINKAQELDENTDDQLGSI